MAKKNNKLGEYTSKRAFDATPEPAGVEVSGAGPLLFVVQQHSARRMHYDFRLECDGVLISWAVPKGPSLDRSEKRFAVQTEDHPYDYASFEGVIPPKQYGAGEVIVWDCGVYSPDEEGTWFHDRAEAQRQVRDGLAKGKLSILLRGEKLKGSFALVKMKEDKNWLLIKHQDRFVTKDEVTDQNRSVLSHIAVNEMSAKPVHRMAAVDLVPTGKPVKMPAKIEPMHAEIFEAPFNNEAWAWEPKLDGYRVIAYVDAAGVQLKSRRGLELSGSFPKLVAELRRQDVDGMILDGEIVAFDASGKPSFNALQNRVQAKTPHEIAAAEQTTTVVYFCFDLLYFAGIDLRARPYRDRRRYLSQCLLPTPLVQLVQAWDDGVALHEAALASGFEGVIGKRKDSRYEAGKRVSTWLKVKPTQTADFVIGGYTAGKGSRTDLGSLLLGVWDKDRLRYVSNVGSGFNDRSLREVKKQLDERKRKKSPFAEKPPVPGAITWVEPDLVAEVTFQSWTDDGSLRAPVFVRLRDDIDAASVHRVEANQPRPKAAPKSAEDDTIAQVLAQLETKKNAFTLAVGADAIKLTHLDRAYWPADEAFGQPALTKRDLLRYFAQVSKYILPHLADRPLTMIRMPDGIAKQRFFQKHWEQEKPAFVETITVWSDSKDESHDY
ncbi:MAG TPA: non-homologous end-joining DNA ligase, partial [Rudaea sp.]